MNSFGPRRSWQNHPPSAQPDLARRAVIGGGVLTLVLVLLAFVTGFWGGPPPAADPPAATSSAAALGTDLEPAKAGSGKSDSDSGDDSDEDGSKDSKDSGKSKSKSDKSDKGGKSKDKSDSGESKDSGKSAKKHGSSSSSSSSSDGAGVLAGLGDAFSPGGGSSSSSGGGSSSRVLPPNFSVPSRRASTGVGGWSNGVLGRDSDSGFNGPGGSDPSVGAISAGGGSTRGPSGSTTCTMVVSDRASLDRELQDLGPDEVVCLRGSSRASSGPGGLPSSSPGLPGGFGGSVTDAGRTSPYVARSSGSGTRSTSSYVGPGQSSGNITLGSESGSGGDGKCTQEVTDSAGFERALKGARDGDKVCIGVGDLGVRLEVGKGGASGLSIQIAGLGALASKGIQVQTDDVQAEHNNVGRITTR